MIPTGGDFDVNRIARGPMIFPTWQRDQRDALPPRVQSPAIKVMSQEGESVISEGSGSKLRSPNWTDAEVRLLINVWKDYFPISKRQNSTIWERISKQLNQLLAEQNLPCIRTAQQCKAKIKNLEDDYKGLRMTITKERSHNLPKLRRPQRCSRL